MKPLHPFTYSLNSNQIREVVRGTAKAVKEDIEYKWDEIFVET